MVTPLVWCICGMCAVLFSDHFTGTHTNASVCNKKAQKKEEQEAGGGNRNRTAVQQNKFVQNYNTCKVYVKTISLWLGSCHDRRVARRACLIICHLAVAKTLFWLRDFTTFCSLWDLLKCMRLFIT